MFNNISWSQYATIIIFSALIYYAYILFVYYRGDLRGILASSKPFSSAGNELTISSNQIKSKTPEVDDLFPAVQSLNDEIMAYLEQASTAGASKPEVLFALQQITRKYGSLRNTSFQNAVNSLLQFECGDKCNIHLDEADVKQVWLG